jgi:hypothetical protein
VNKLIYSLAFFLFVSVTTVVGQPGVRSFISFNDKHLDFEGRIGFSDSCAAFYWTGTNVTITVKNAGDVKALLADSTL